MAGSYFDIAQQYSTQTLRSAYNAVADTAAGMRNAVTSTTSQLTTKLRPPPQTLNKAIKQQLDLTWKNLRRRHPNLNEQDKAHLEKFADLLSKQIAGYADYWSMKIEELAHNEHSEDQHNPLVKFLEFGYHGISGLAHVNTSSHIPSHFAAAAIKTSLALNLVPLLHTTLATYIGYELIKSYYPHKKRLSVSPDELPTQGLNIKLLTVANQLRMSELSTSTKKKLIANTITQVIEDFYSIILGAADIKTLSRAFALRIVSTWMLNINEFISTRESLADPNLDRLYDISQIHFMTTPKPDKIKLKNGRTVKCDDLITYAPIITDDGSIYFFPGMQSNQLAGFRRVRFDETRFPENVKSNLLKLTGATQESSLQLLSDNEWRLYSSDHFKQWQNQPNPDAKKLPRKPDAFLSDSTYKSLIACGPRIHESFFLEKNSTLPLLAACHLFLEAAGEKKPYRLSKDEEKQLNQVKLAIRDLVNNTQHDLPSPNPDNSATEEPNPLRTLASNQYVTRCAGIHRNLIWQLFPNFKTTATKRQLLSVEQSSHRPGN